MHYNGACWLKVFMNYKLQSFGKNCANKWSSVIRELNMEQKLNMSSKRHKLSSWWGSWSEGIIHCWISPFKHYRAWVSHSCLYFLHVTKSPASNALVSEVSCLLGICSQTFTWENRSVNHDQNLFLEQADASAVDWVKVDLQPQRLLLYALYLLVIGRLHGHSAGLSNQIPCCGSTKFDASFVLLIKSILFLFWQINMSAVKMTYYLRKRFRWFSCCTQHISWPIGTENWLQVFCCPLVASESWCSANQQLDGYETLKAKLICIWNNIINSLGAIDFRIKFTLMIWNDINTKI